MNHKCIIFDCDGVLVDSEEISNRVLIELSNNLGAGIDYDYGIEQFYGKSMRYIFDHIQTLIDQKLPMSFEQDFRRRTFELFETDLKPVSGIHELLDQIQVPYCVASNGPLGKMKLNLKVTNLIDRFENKMFSAYEIGKWKPDPGIFQYAAKKMGFDVLECLVIEDSLVGIQAAKKGGFEVLAFANKSNKEAFLKEGAQVFFSMKELQEMLIEVRSTTWEEGSKK
jgi:HAD superfamily hydrolase (TIGR01509 family)